MTFSIIAVLETIVASITVLVVGGLWRTMSAFIKEQRAVNEANRLSNLSIQREVIYRMFNDHVEHDEPMAPHEMDHLNDVYAAYHANGGNSTATAMYEKIREHGKLSTEVK